MYTNCKERGGGCRESMEVVADLALGLDAIPEVENDLFNETHFDRYELRLLYVGLGGREKLSVTQVIRLLCADEEIRPFIQYVFNSLAPENDGHMLTSTFIKGLSVISRGAQRERLKLVFDIIDNKKLGYITKRDMQQMAYVAEKLLIRYNFGQENMSSPEEAVHDIFDAFIGRDQLDVREFILSAALDPDAHRCFGLFDLFYFMLVKPVEQKLQRDTDSPSIVGKLHRTRTLTWFRWYKHSWCEVRNGFVIIYKNYKKRIPFRVICLRNSTTTILTRSAGHVWDIGKQLHYLRQKVLDKTCHVIGEETDGRHFRIDSTLSKITLISADKEKAINWVSTLRANARGAYQYQSFAPPRDGISAKWYVNASDYFLDVADALLSAEKEVFIAGWWLVAKIYLKRPTPRDKSMRLDRILHKLAARGVQIYIIIWDESNLGVNLGSRWTKFTLESMHSNIRVIRHPRFAFTWSHHQKMVIVDQNISFLGGLDLCHGRYDDDYFRLNDPDSKYPGADYRNPCLVPSSRPTLSAKTFLKEELDRATQWRLPWHDTAVRVDGRAARDTASNFIQRWNHCIDDNRRKIKYPYLFPSPDPPLNTNGTCVVQILRSVGLWSAGQPVEDSIYKAHINLINSAKHFIYIQNQYFISSTTTKRPKNKIALALVRRIRRAIFSKETFRVIIVLPIHSEGYLVEKRTSVLVEWSLRTIHAMLSDLQSEFALQNVNLDNYISFNSLRNWGAFGNIVVTEQVYVHSKLLIVDDEVALIGSANINDRSMRGTRDTEIAAVVRDTDHVNAKMGGEKFMASKFAHELRMKLWKLHLGLSHTDPEYEAIKDPIHDNTYHMIWRLRSKSNSKIYKEIFNEAIPENVAKIEDLDKEVVVDIGEGEEKLRMGVKGFVVDFPYRLLAEDAHAPANPPKWFSKLFL